MSRYRRAWRAALVPIIAVAALVALGITQSSALTAAAESIGDVRPGWLALAVAAEGGSMAAFARAQRRLLRVGGTPVHLGSVMAVTYAGNAISVSLPLAGSEVSTAYTFHRFSRQGIEPAVVTWALLVSGLLSSLAFALVVAGGAVTSGAGLATAFGLVVSAISLLPAIGALAAIRFVRVRASLNRALAFAVARSRQRFGRPGAEAEGALDRLLDQVAALHLSPLQYAEVLALAVWNWVADCLCLAFAIRATGATPPWHGLFLAYGIGMTAGSLGLTPGGLGIIEAALAAALVSAGLTSHHALAAVLVYRLISFWLVMMIGWVVLALLRRTGTGSAAAAGS